MGNVSARDRPYPEDSVMGMKEESRTEYGSSRVALDGIAANVKRVHVEGLVRTKEDVVSISNKHSKNFALKFESKISESEKGWLIKLGIFQVAASIEPVLKVQHFEELVLAAQDARNRLQDLGCFSDVEIHIDTSEDGGKSDYEVLSCKYIKKIVLNECGKSGHFKIFRGFQGKPKKIPHLHNDFR